MRCTTQTLNLTRFSIQQVLSNTCGCLVLLVYSVFYQSNRIESNRIESKESRCCQLSTVWIPFDLFFSFVVTLLQLALPIGSPGENAPNGGFFRGGWQGPSPLEKNGRRIFAGRVESSCGRTSTCPDLVLLLFPRIDDDVLASRNFSSNFGLTSEIRLTRRETNRVL